MVLNEIRIIQEIFDNNSQIIPEGDRLIGLNALMRINNMLQQRTDNMLQQQTDNRIIQLTENDLHKFGYHTHANYDDDEANRGTVFVCSHHTFQLEEIFIRSILAALNCEIIEIDYDHVVPDQDACDVRFITNYPWSRYYNGPMTTTMYSIQLTENDLHQFGYCKHANYDEDANRGTVFVCSHHTFQLEEILIRSILAPLNYEIREIDYDHVPNQDACDVRFITNYPWIRYCP